MLSKTCFKCNEHKPLYDFYKHSEMRDGHLNKCIKCTCADVMKHRLKNIEKVRAYDNNRATLPHRKEKQKSIFKRWETANKKRRAAQLITRKAIKSGALVMMPCFICGDDKVEAHHPDYDTPLAVAWLCSKHHHQAHAIVKYSDDDPRLQDRLAALD